MACYGAQVDGSAYFTPTDTSGTPGDATVKSISGRAAWPAGITQVTITIPGVDAGFVLLTAVEPTPGTLATFRYAQAEVVAVIGGTFTANRSSGVGVVAFNWRVL